MTKKTPFDCDDLDTVLHRLGKAINERDMEGASEALVELRMLFDGAEPLATKQPSDPYDERDGIYFSMTDTEKLKALPARSKLFTHPVLPVPPEWVQKMRAELYGEQYGADLAFNDASAEQKARDRGYMGGLAAATSIVDQHIRKMEEWGRQQLRNGGDW